MIKNIVHTELTEKVDHEPGIIKNVSVLGSKSKNGREYSVKAMKKAVSDGIYEGYNIYLDHTGKPTTGRTVNEHFGRITGVKFDATGKRVRAGQLTYLRSHPFAARLEEDLERGLGYFGLSHSANGDVTMKNGKEIVENITSVKSVDLVTDPATGTLLEQTEMAPEGDGGQAAIEDAFCAAVEAVVKGPGTKEEKIAKIKEILDAEEEINGGGEAAAETPAETPPANEQVTTLVKTVANLQEQLTTLAKANDLKTKLQQKYTKPTATPVNQEVDEQVADGPPVDLAERRKWYLSL